MNVDFFLLFVDCSGSHENLTLVARQRETTQVDTKTPDYPRKVNVCNGLNNSVNGV
ncbi:hypothetical protein [Bacillus weihaiensis]|uniref:hypothetical protein n=1 Tax=Bacillus weihaiensis TaxID=1547283 RepID=UPI00235405BD|nr:hypothetical protein [Bacillus weihaiensis]